MHLYPRFEVIWRALRKGKAPGKICICIRGWKPTLRPLEIGDMHAVALMQLVSKSYFIFIFFDITIISHF
jgi:hypothetical protein